MFMVAHKGLFNVKVIQKLYRHSRVLSAYKIHLGQNPHRTICYILKVADWSTDNIQLSRHSSFSFILIFPVMTVNLGKLGAYSPAAADIKLRHNLHKSAPAFSSFNKEEPWSGIGSF